MKATWRQHTDGRWKPVYHIADGKRSSQSESVAQPQKRGGCCGCDPDSEQYCCNWSTTEHKVMNARFLFDVIAIIITFMSGIGFWMLTGLFGGNSALSLWLMIIYYDHLHDLHINPFVQLL